MKIAGVSVNVESLPSRKTIIKMALNTLKYQNVNNAEELINIEIDKSGLYRNISKGTKVSYKPTESPGS